MSDHYTDFSSYSHGDLRRMVEAMDSGGAMAASDPWRRTADTLKQLREALTLASAEATSTWEGATSDAFMAKMTRVTNIVNNSAAYANDAAVALQIISEAIDQAKRDMPEEPGFWDKVGNAVEDAAKGAVGVDDESTRVSIADQRKAQAVAVMETLSTKYRSTQQFLKPPPRPPYDDENQLPPPDGSALLGEMIIGAGMAFAAASPSAGAPAEAAPRTVSRSQVAPQPPKTAQPKPGPSDPGVKGGTPNPVQERPAPVKVAPIGPGTSLDGGVVTKSPGTGSASPVFGGTTGSGAGEPGGSGVAFGGLNVGRLGDGRAADGAGAARLGGAFGTQEAEAGRSGAGRGLGAGTGSRTGAAAGGAGAGAGGSGRRAFTEGGSGLGRSRGTVGQAGGQQAHGMHGDTHAAKKDKKKGKERPDYLVEDEETWVSGKPATPNVVE